MFKQFHTLLYLGLITLSKPLFAQTDIEAEYLSKTTALNIAVVDGNLRIEERNYSEKKFYRNFEKHSRESIYFSDFDPITSIEATSFLPDRSGYRKEKVSTIETKDIVQPGIFYGGYKRKDFFFPKLSAGAIGRLEYSKNIKDPHLLSPFYFADDIDVKESTFTVTAPVNLKLKYKLFGDGKDLVNFTEQVVDGKIKKYNWTLKNIPAFKRERDSPPQSFIAPHLIVYVQSYDYRGKTVRVLSDVSDLYTWYNSLVKMIPPQDNGTLQQHVNKLTEGLASEADKIRVIFQWVQSNIKYIAFEDGMAGFVPRSSMDVFVKRYGDCKDMANLLKDMLSLAGIEAYHTWIGTRSRPYTYDDVPSAIADDHMICTVKMNDDYVFLDATNAFTSFGKPSSMIQGKEALIGINTKDFKVVKVPVVSRAENIRADTLLINLDNTVVMGKFTSQLQGYKKDDFEINQFRAALANNDQSIRDFFGIGSNNIVIEKPSILGLGEQDKHAMVSFSFRQPNYVKAVGDKIYVNLHLNKTLPGEKIEPSRRQAFEADYQFEERSVTILSIPAGYDVTYIPENISKDWGLFGFTITYRKTENSLIVEKRFHSEYLYLNSDQFQNFNEMIGKLVETNQQSVILSRKN